MIITITFPTQTFQSGETIQLIMAFTKDAVGDDQSINAYDQGLTVISWGSNSVEYDIEKAFALPGRASLVIGDADLYLDNLIFGTPGVDVQALITIKVNGNDDFIGNIIEDSIEFDKGTRELNFTAAPKIDIINKRMVYDDDGNALNPFSLTNNTYPTLISILEKIYQLVNTNISYDDGSLEIIHDWRFVGWIDPAMPVSDVLFTELQQLTTPLFYDSARGISTVGDILKQLALDWCAFTGMVNNNKAFFKKLFHYSADNLQNVQVLSHKKGYKYGLIDYVEIETDLNDPNEPYTQGTFTQLQDRYMKLKSIPGYLTSAGGSLSNVEALIERANGFCFHTSNTDYDIGDIYEQSGIQFQIAGINTISGSYNVTMYRISESGTPASTGTLYPVPGPNQSPGAGNIVYDSSTTLTGSQVVKVYQCRDDSINLEPLKKNRYKNHAQQMALFWYNYRGNIQNCRIDSFVMHGIDYDFLKDFNYDGNKYQPIKMTKHYSQLKTEIEAIYLGAV